MQGWHSTAGWRLFIGLWLLATGIGLAQANSKVAKPPTQLPTQAFSQLPQVSDIRLSPDGERIAFIQNMAEGDDGISVLQVYDFATQTPHYLLRSDGEKVKINWFHWVNSQQVAVSALYEVKQRGVRYYKTRMYIIDYAQGGANLRPVVNVDRMLERRRAAQSPQYLDKVVDWLKDDPQHILMAIDNDVAHMPSVYKVNVNNFRLQRIERGKRHIRHWMTDQQARLRLGIAQNYDNGERRVFIRANEEADWQELFAYNALTDKAISPKGFGLNPNILYYTAYQGDLKALFKMDLTNRTSKLVFADPNYDVDGGLIYSPETGEAIGVHHATASGGKHFWTPRWARLQTSLDKAMPDFNNTLVSFSQDETHYILYSKSDGLPPYYSLGNTQTNKLTVLFNSYPHLAGLTLPTHQPITYTARDGLTIEGYLTLPVHGEPPYPTIIHPHGGPGARDFDGFDIWLAYFTHRGYAVLRPNFRGSTGYGWEFAQARMQGWGLQMQDDVTDATHWLVKQGLADPDKLCIVGGSYGGYAALMATVKTPNLFRCAVSINGVSDLPALVRENRRFLNYEFVKQQLGEDSDDMEARSPYYHADKITTPVLLVHGEEDRSVPVKQSRRMAEALEDEEHPAFRYVELEAGDHYLSLQRNRHRTFAEMDQFLSRYLGRHSATPAVTASE